ncbi:BglG family transcription antiterminator [Pediococcus pentosaceus]|uniref:BglG family transcription antiterminator n=1 Tax=Pediococcus pentosaceus TaxID=1255 RepID=UPI00288B1BF9|nr:PTS sugar transporter subunit IIA [Pediococcus pentosaceus]MCT3033599.1 PRD domain-containing protein [Pediococcus pentosaceus]
MNLKERIWGMRTYQILKSLAENQDHFLSISYFMEMLGVSKRTIQSEISYLKKGGKDKGYKIGNSLGKGYFIEISDQEKFEDYLNDLDNEDFDKKERTIINEELSELLAAGDSYITVIEMASKMHLSKTLLYEKNKIIAEYLNSYGLVFERKSHYGIKIKGISSNIKKLMFDLYLDRVQKFSSIVDEKLGKFDGVEELIEESIAKNNLNVGYYEFQEMISWLKVSVFYQIVYEDPGKQAVEYPGTFYEILRYINSKYGVWIPKSDIHNFTEKITHAESKEININKKELKQYLITFFKEIDVKNSTDYSGDIEFISNLLKHLEFLIERLNQQVSYKNPLLLELCIEYSRFFDIVLKFSKMLEEKLGYKISNDELGFIAVHFLNHMEKEKVKRINKYKKVAIICTTGGGISNFIRNKIMTIFPKSEIDTFSFYQNSQIRDFEPNIIFSVIPLKESFDVPIIYIKELLTDKDLEDIREMLFLEKENIGAVREKDKKSFTNLLIEDMFSISKETNYKKLLSNMAEELEDKGYGDAKFRENVLRREKYMSTVYLNGIAMPHSIEINAKKSGIALKIIEPELIENNKKVKLVFMICLAKKNVDYYSAISSGIYKLMKNKVMISEICEKKDFYSTKNILKKLENL